MPVIAYLANEFPSPVEPYVCDEIHELRKRGAEVLCCSVFRPRGAPGAGQELLALETLYLWPLRLSLLGRAAWLCLRKSSRLADLLARLWRGGNEPLGRRFRALAHTWLGAYYALVLLDRDVQHIHVHHGYFSSWIATVAARLLNIDFSFTLHGSDLLLHAPFLDTKLQNCQFCCTVSEFNRKHILENYPEVSEEKVALLRLGVDAPTDRSLRHAPRPNPCLVMLSVGRLHAVKNHAFLLRACRELKNRRIQFRCVIAGDGPERVRLERLAYVFDLLDEVGLVGHIPRHQLDAYYAACDLVVLTSHSEGIPLVLMEAMAHGKAVLAPAITGIPELVIDGKTGFLYSPGSLEDFVARVVTIARSQSALGPVRREARRHVLAYFDRQRNLTAFVDLLLARIPGAAPQERHEDPVLQ